MLLLSFKYCVFYQLLVSVVCRSFSRFSTRWRKQLVLRCGAGSCCSPFPTAPPQEGARKGSEASRAGLLLLKTLTGTSVLRFTGRSWRAAQNPWMCWVARDTQDLWNPARGPAQGIPRDVPESPVRAWNMASVMGEAGATAVCCLSVDIQPGLVDKPASLRFGG